MENVLWKMSKISGKEQLSMDKSRSDQKYEIYISESMLLIQIQLMRLEKRR